MGRGWYPHAADGQYFLSSLIAAVVDGKESLAEMSRTTREPVRYGKVRGHGSPYNRSRRDHAPRPKSARGDQQQKSCPNRKSTFSKKKG